VAQNLLLCTQVSVHKIRFPRSTGETVPYGRRTVASVRSISQWAHMETSLPASSAR
jgi:hypothetical protein